MSASLSYREISGGKKQLIKRKKCFGTNNQNIIYFIYYVSANLLADKLKNKITAQK